MRDPCAMTVFRGKRRGSLRVASGCLPVSHQIASGWPRGGLGWPRWQPGTQYSARSTETAKGLVDDGDSLVTAAADAVEGARATGGNDEVTAAQRAAIGRYRGPGAH